MTARRWQQIDALFSQALEVAPEQQAAWLRQNCGHDDELLISVEQLLRADSSLGDFLESDPIISLAREESDNEMPRQFGHYRVLHLLGQGGMGEVFLAERDDGEFEQRVAVKLLAYPTPGLLQRFRQERQILARLNHPSIAHLIDGGLTESGQPYFVMEYVQGLPIHEYCRKHALDTTARLRLFLGVCEAVRYAHQNLVVHRDLKPSNILVTIDGVPKLLDFGIAKLLAASVDDADPQTAAHLFTPPYAAPEQIRGGTITTATDVYALGVVLYEMLVGQRPHRRSEAQASVEQVILEDDALAPSVSIGKNLADASLRRALRGDLDRIVLKALQKVPLQRYPSVEAFADDLQRHLSGHPVTAVGDAWSYQLRKFARRHRIGVAIGAFGFALLMIGIAGIAWEAQRTHQQAMRIEAEAQHAREQAERADVVRQFLVGVLDDAKPDSSPGGAITAHELLDKATHRLDENHIDVAAIKADILDVLGKLYFDIGDYDAAENLLTQAQLLSDTQAVPPGIHARILLHLANIAQRRGAYPIARTYLQQSLALTEGSENVQMVSDIRHVLDTVEMEASGINAQPVVRATLAYDRAHFGGNNDAVQADLVALAWSLLSSSQLDEMEKAANQAVAIARELHGQYHSSVASALEVLGYAREARGDLVGAEGVLDQALTINTQVLGAVHPNTLQVESDLLLMLEEQGRYREVLPRRLRNIEHERAAVGDTNSSLAYAYENLGDTQRELGQFNAAEISLHQALRIWESLDNTNDPQISAVRVSLGSALYLEGKLRDAKAELEQAQAVARSHFGENSARTRRALYWLARVAIRENRAPDVLESITNNLVAVRAEIPSNRLELQYALTVAAEVQLASGHPDVADELAKSALVLNRQLYPAGSHRLGTALLLLGRSAAMQGRYIEAEASLREALQVRGTVYAATDPRIIEIEFALATTLAAQHQSRAARLLLSGVRKHLDGVNFPYAIEARQRASELLASAK